VSGPTRSPGGTVAHPIVVVGASAAGLAAAEGLRSRGYDGGLVLIDPDPDLPYERPALSTSLLRDLDGPQPVSPPDDRLERLAAERVHDRAAGLDVDGHEVLLAGGRRLRYRSLVVATGATPHRPAALDGPVGVHTLRDLADARALRHALASATSLVVVGAGFLGTEVAAAAASAGRTVTLVDPLPAPVAPLGSLVSGLVADLHRSHGVDLLLGRSVTEVLGSERVTGVRLDDGRTVPADVVLLALGVAPADSWLADSPLRRDGGVVVDEHLRAAPDVFAAGDVARAFSPRYRAHLRVEHWTTAVGHGDLAAAVALEGPAAASPPELPYVWTEQYDARLCVLGRTLGHQATVVDRQPGSDRLVVAYTDREGRVEGVLTWNWARMLGPWRAHVAAATRLADLL
jgi:3-phenylpropionate/trans-cinnamate dioxygenase ferredoxin reductase subunit